MRIGTYVCTAVIRTMLAKVYCNIGLIPCDTFKKSTYVYLARNEKTLVQPKGYSFNRGIYSFTYEGGRLWNLLNPER